MNKAIKCLCDIIWYNVDEGILRNLCTVNKLAYGIGVNEDVSNLEISAKSVALLVQKDDLQQQKGLMVTRPSA